MLYAINAIDNKVADWHTGWTQKAERLGIANMVVSSKRNLDRGFESKLVSQLPLLNHIKQRVSYDYIFTIDGDISFAGADVHGLFRSIRSARPLIAQPTIRVPASLVGGNMFSWGSQWYKALNHDQASTNPNTLTLTLTQTLTLTLTLTLTRNRTLTLTLALTPTPTP